MVTTQRKWASDAPLISSRILSLGKHIITLISERMRNSASKEKSHRQATRPAENPGCKKQPAHKTIQQCTLESVFFRNKAGGNSDHNRRWHSSPSERGRLFNKITLRQLAHDLPYKQSWIPTLTLCTKTNSKCIKQKIDQFDYLLFFLSFQFVSKFVYNILKSWKK